MQIESLFWSFLGVINLAPDQLPARCRVLFEQYPLVDVFVSVQRPDLLFVCSKSPRKGNLDSHRPDRYVHW